MIFEQTDDEIKFDKMSYQKKHFKSILKKEKALLDSFRPDNSNIHNLIYPEMSEFGTRTFTIEELSFYNGSGGRPAYVAVNGIVYDVSLNSAWGGGTHFSLYSGQDLSMEFNSCHNGNENILKSLPVVGVMIKDNSQEN